MIRPIVAWVLAGFTSSLTFALLHAQQSDQIPNNFPHRNAGGYGATFSSQGVVDLTGEYFQAQGTNGRSCVTCHVPEEAWAITPATLQRLFDETAGTHPVFNALDANNTAMPEGSIEEKLAKYSMLLSRGVFRRGGPPLATAEWELIAVDDPHGFARLDRLVHWRRSMPTINFALGSTTVNWDGGNSIGSDQHLNLVNQATRNITGAQQAPPPAPPEVVAAIVAFEESLSTAQMTVFGVGRLDEDHALGGPESLASMTKRRGPFDLYDAWRGSDNPRRAQIARGQDLFNIGCSGCHSSANNGTNFDNQLFNIGTANAAVRTPDLPLYRFRKRGTEITRQLTDAGQGQVTGKWEDLGKFKTPTIRALAARAPYFHNGIAATLEAVVRFYEDHLNFTFTDAERADLVAFLNAL